jgi:hypothetical protein
LADSVFEALPFLIPFGFAIFVLRAQLLRIGIAELGLENLHSSKVLGSVSGWLGLSGAAVLACVAFAYGGIVWGLVLVTGGLMLGILLSAVSLPILRSTFALGHHSGDGDKSVAEFNRQYGPFIALAVAAVATICLYALFSFRL